MFGQNVKKELRRRGMTASELAALTHVSVTSMSEYIRGQCEPNSVTKAKIALALGVDVGYLGRENKLVPSLTVKEAATVLGVDEATVRRGLQQGVFPWGYAVENPDTGKYWYFINRRKLVKEEMIESEQAVLDLLA